MENKIKKSLHLDLGLLDARKLSQSLLHREFQTQKKFSCAQDATKSNKHLDIDKKMTFGEVLKNHPELAQVFWEEGMHCIGCPHAEKESIEDGCMMHGIRVEELIEKLNKKLNDKIKKGGKS